MLKDCGESVGVSFLIPVGLVLGVVAFLPLIAAVRAVKFVTSTSNFSHASILLLALGASIMVLLVSIVICAAFDKSQVVYLGLSEAGGLIITALVFALLKILNRGKH